jgi:hypothetical protein
MTNPNRPAGIVLLACLVLLASVMGRTAQAQDRKPTGPPKNPDGYLAVAVLYEDGGTKIVKSDTVVARREKRVDFYLLNLTGSAVDFSIEFNRGGKSTWICEEAKAKKGVGVRPADGTISCKLAKATVDALCGNDDPCLVDFAYRVTRSGGSESIVADPQLEIRR